MAARETVSLSLQADISDLKRELGSIPGITKREASKMARELQTQYNKAERAAKKAAKATKVSWADAGRGAAQVGAAVAGAAVAVVAFGQHMADLNNQLTDTATVSTLAVEQIAGIKLAAEGSGVAFASVEKGLRALPKAMADAAKGTGTAARAFEQMGIDVENAATGGLRDASELLPEIFAGLNALPDQASKSAAAMDIFGAKAGGALVQSGAIENMEAFVALSAEFGISTGPKASAAAADFQRQMATLKLVTEGTLSRVLDQFGGPGGLNDVLELATGAVIVMGSTFAAVFAELNTQIQSVVGPITEVALRVIEGDLSGALKAAERNAAELGSGLLNLAPGVLPARLAAAAAEGMATGFTQADEAAKSLARTLATTKKDGGGDDGGGGSSIVAGGSPAKVDERAKAFARLQEQQRTAAEARLADLDRIEQKYREQIEVIRDGQAAGVEIADADAALNAAQVARLDELRMLHQQASDERIAQLDAEAEHQRLKMQQTVNASGDAAGAVGEVFGIASAAFAESSTVASQKAAKALFIASKAAAGAMIGLRVAEGLMVAQTLLPPASGIKSAAVIAQGAASAAAIAASQPPTFDRGGIVMAGTGDQVDARVLPGEAMLNRTATNALGSRMIDQLNTNDGRSMTGGGQVVNVWKGRVYDDFITDSREARFSPVYGGT